MLVSAAAAVACLVAQWAWPGARAHNLAW
jgi:hypothetical protein